MLPYILLFTIIIFISFSINKYANKNNKKAVIILTSISIFMLSLFAALRSYDVGKDINTYGLKLFERANILSLSDYIEYNKKYAEIFYLIYNYIVCHICNNFRFLLFTHQMILSLIVYIIGIKNKDRLSLPMLICGYLFIWYAASFNIIRQSITIFILFYAYKYIEEKKYIKYYILNVIAILFHTSGYIGLFIPILSLFSNKKNKKVKYFLITLCIIFLVFSFDKILSLLVNNNVLGTRYLFYLSNGTININFSITLIKLLLIIIIIIFSNKKHRNNNSFFVNYLTIVELIIYQISAFTKYGYRLSYVLLPFYIYAIAYTDKSIQNRTNKIVYRLLIIIVLSSLWYIRHVFCGYDGIYPFSF